MTVESVFSLIYLLTRYIPGKVIKMMVFFDSNFVPFKFVGSIWGSLSVVQFSVLMTSNIESILIQFK